MKHTLIFAGAFAIAAAVPTFAQVPMAAGTSAAGSMTAEQVGASPMTGTSTADYIAKAADSDRYEIMSSRLATERSKRKDVVAFAGQMISDHNMTTKNLMAATKPTDRQVLAPAARLSADNQAKIDQLKKAPKGSFDSLYIQQQLDAHKTAWALHKGYSMDGQDSALRQVATTAVPVIEEHLAHVKGLAGSAM